VIAQLRSELHKQRSTRTSLLLMAWMVGLVVLVVALHVLSFGATDLSRQSNQMRILGLGTAIGALFAALFGALSITAEFRTGTIRPTLLVTPRRTRVIAAKVGASMLAGVGVGVLAEALTAGGEAVGLAARGVEVELTGGDYAQLVAGGAAAAAFFAAIGVGVGAAVRNRSRLSSASACGCCSSSRFCSAMSRRSASTRPGRAPAPSPARSRARSPTASSCRAWGSRC
jgi:ABC-2 type transport system permease protein